MHHQSKRNNSRKKMFYSLSSPGGEGREKEALFLSPRQVHEKPLVHFDSCSTSMNRIEDEDDNAEDDLKIGLWRERPSPSPIQWERAGVRAGVHLHIAS